MIWFFFLIWWMTIVYIYRVPPPVRVFWPSSIQRNYLSRCLKKHRVPRSSVITPSQTENDMKWMICIYTHARRMSSCMYKYIFVGGHRIKTLCASLCIYTHKNIFLYALLRVFFFPFIMVPLAISIILYMKQRLEYSRHSLRCNNTPWIILLRFWALIIGMSNSSG